MSINDMLNAMTDDEVALCLALTLKDIRGSWGNNLEGRLGEAADLAARINSEPHIRSIAEFYEEIADGNADGRFFRMSWEAGGYEDYPGCRYLPGSSQTVVDYYTVSQNVRDYVDSALEYPEYALDGHPDA